MTETDWGVKGRGIISTMKRVASAVWLFSSAFASAAEPRVQRDVPYAQPKNPRQTLDVYSPSNARNRPIVFWIHGGGWVRAAR